MRSTQHDSTATPPTCKEKVEKTFFDTDFFKDEKIQFLISEYGNSGPTWYLRIALAILAEGGSFHRRMAVAALKQLSATQEQAEGFIATCIEIGAFYEHDNALRSYRADREVAALSEKRDKWREKQGRYRKSSATPKDVPGDTPGTLGRHSGDYEKEKEEEKEPEKVLEGELVQEQEPRKRRAPKPPIGKSEHQPGVWLTSAEAEHYLATYGREFFERCCEKLSAWIEQEPTPKRRRNGVNAAATFRVWVVNAVAREESQAQSAPRAAPSRAERAIQENLNLAEQLRAGGE